MNTANVKLLKIRVVYVTEKSMIEKKLFQVVKSIKRLEHKFPYFVKCSKIKTMNKIGQECPEVLMVNI